MEVNLLSRSLPDDYEGENLVLIVGCPRSGTTWLQMLLCLHPNIRTGPESHVFDGIIGPQLRKWQGDLRHAREGKAAIGLPSYFLEQEFVGLLKWYLCRLLEPMVGNLSTGTLFLEKTPNHALYIPQIMELLPRVRLIYLVRDARDVVSSLLRSSRGWGAGWAPSKIWRAASMWREYTTATTTALSTLEESQFVEVRYEELLGKPAETLSKLAKFLNLEWSEQDLVSAISRCTASTLAQNGRTPIPVWGESAKYVGNVFKLPGGFIGGATSGSWKKDLSPFQKFVLWWMLSKGMKDVGYGWRFPW